MTCANCGQTVAEGLKFCGSCGAAIPFAAAGAVGATTVAPPVPATKPCPYCGEQIMQAAVRCRFCSSDLTAPRQQGGGIVVTGPPPAAAGPSIVIQNVQAAQPPAQQAFIPHQVKNPGLALLLSIIFPGGGQFYNGHVGKGILILCTFWLIIPYIYGIFDAYSSANRINRVGF
ncbi:MAG: TM2 domain-containing protein [Bryobacteraceae bacterium]|jgi:TM2 domain-containing membrane protein YozV